MNVGTLKYGVFERDGKAKVHILQTSRSQFRIIDARRARVQNFVFYEAWRPKSVHPCGKSCVVSFVPSQVFVQPLLPQGTLKDVTRNLQKKEMELKVYLYGKVKFPDDECIKELCCSVRINTSVTVEGISK